MIKITINNKNHEIEKTREFLENYEISLQKNITCNKNCIIVENYEELDKYIDEALNTNKNKAMRLGRINENIVQNIKIKIQNLPKNKNDFISKNKYDLVLHQSEIRHFKSHKTRVTNEDIHLYVRNLPQIITACDNVSYSNNGKDEGLRFKKKIDESHYISFILVSNKKSTFTVKSISLEKADFETQKKKHLFTE